MHLFLPQWGGWLLALGLPVPLLLAPCFVQRVAVQPAGIAIPKGLGQEARFGWASIEKGSIWN